ncbi:hypothetical protein GCM10027157_01060 [Corynebacterium aquatimens]
MMKGLQRGEVRGTLCAVIGQKPVLAGDELAKALRIDPPLDRMEDGHVVFQLHRGFEWFWCWVFWGWVFWGWVFWVRVFWM